MGEQPPKDNHPPGWNDPPMLNYSTSNPPPKSRITNKRIPFPLDASPSPSQQPQLVGVPPPHPAQLSQPPQLSEGSEEEEVPMAEPLPPTENFLPCLFAKANENFNQALGCGDKQNLRPEISTLMSLWLSGQFPEDVQEVLCTISDMSTSTKNRVELFLKLDANEKVQKFIPALKKLYENWK